MRIPSPARTESHPQALLHLVHRPRQPEASGSLWEVEREVPGIQRGSTYDAPARVSSGVPTLDAALGGGWPRGRISELCGARSAGRTALAMHTVATATRSGGLVAWVDLADTLYPLSLARAGAELSRVFWVRPPNPTAGWRCAEWLLQSKGFVVLVLDLGHAVPRTKTPVLWVRLQRAAERGQAALLLLAPRGMAGSFSALRLRLERRRLWWPPATWPVFLGWESAGVLERNKLGAEGRRVLLPVRLPTALGCGGA